MFEHFVTAQGPVYATALAELRAGTKQTHWMWFVFPQVAGLGHSPMAQRYAIADLAEAQAYLAHPLLGARLREATSAALNHPDTSLAALFGLPDDLKFCSSMTLFHRAAPDDALFVTALKTFCGGREDSATLARL